MADFEALNQLRSQTLRQIREMVSEEAALWARYFNGQNAAELVAEIETNRARFRALWEQHERVRQAMSDAGFMPPPVQSEDFPLEDPIRHKTEERLRSEVESARAEYYLASQEFRFFAAQGTGLPAPDGTVAPDETADAGRIGFPAVAAAAGVRAAANASLRAAR